MKINQVSRVESDFLHVLGGTSGEVRRPRAQWLIERVLEHGITSLELEGFKGAFKAHRDRFDTLAATRLEGFITRAGKIAIPPTVTAEVPHGKVADPGVDPADSTTTSYAASGLELFGPGGPKATDPQQDGQGDCGLISTMSAVAAANPQRIVDLFKVKGEGKLAVRLYERAGKGFKRVEVLIDGDLPMKDGKLVYASTATKGAHWVSLLEKAFAKHRGGYANLYAMYPEAALEAILGRHNRTIPLSLMTPEVAVKRIAHWLDAGCAIVTSSAATGDAHGTPMNKIVRDHAYALLRVYEQDGVAMVELRNPWGSFEPKHDGHDDGVFSLTISEFLANYVSLDVTPTGPA